MLVSQHLLARDPVAEHPGATGHGQQRVGSAAQIFVLCHVLLILRAACNVKSESVTGLRQSR
jgi:hypothetical protein